MLRFVTALSMGSMGAVRGCGGGGTITKCRCPATADVTTTDAELASDFCTLRERDAGCETTTETVTSGPLAPPELDA